MSDALPDKALQPLTGSDPDIDYDLLDYLQTLTPAQRLERHDQAMALVRALWAAGARHYGFDPRSPEDAD